MPRAMKLTSIVRYPIKSCRGISVTEARVGPRGIEHDRRLMIVDAAGRFISQREEARLALVGVSLEDETLCLEAPGMMPLEMPARIHEGERCTVTVWRSTVNALVHVPASQWMTRYLGRDARVVYMPDDVHREVNPAYARPGDIVSFADGYPLLLTTESSLRDLNARLEKPVPMSRFRPNIVIDGDSPWVEDSFVRISIGDARFRAPKPCDRCVVITIDPSTAILHKEPLRTLSTFRRRDNKVLFGVNLIPELGDADSVRVTVGDDVCIVDPGD